MDAPPDAVEELASKLAGVPRITETSAWSTFAVGAGRSMTVSRTSIGDILPLAESVTIRRAMYSPGASPAVLIENAAALLAKPGIPLQAAEVAGSSTPIW